jgi:hypothetical protein
MSVHEATDASQSLTWPRVSFVAPEVTEAKKVTTVPEATLAPDVREFVPASMARLVEAGRPTGAAIALQGSTRMSVK